MIASLRNLFRTKVVIPPARVPAGRRVYAVGDVHGRCDLFEALVTAIELDNAERDRDAKAETTYVLLGDLVDRGPDSYGVLTVAREWQRLRDVRILLGNHEEMMLDSLERIDVLKQFVRYGGKETLLSFGIAEDAYEEADWKELHTMMKQAVPERIVEFIRTFEDRIQIGDYLFVHAGIDPAVPLAEQDGANTRWIREPFLSDAGWHGAVVVHGHTITESAQLKDNRIGIDTGAYQSGMLTALGLEGDRRWLLSARTGEYGIETAIELL